MTGLIGTVIEAWDELRIHRLRVLLSLVGVAAAVTAITAVTAAVQILQQGMSEMTERSNGRAVTLSLNVYSNQTGTVTDKQTEAVETAVADALDRYQITWATRDVYSYTQIRTSTGPQEISIRAVDPDFGTIYRTEVTQGRWLVDSDSDSLAPALVVDQETLDVLGITDLADGPTVELGTSTPVLARIVGVYTEPWPDGIPSVYGVYDPLDRWGLIDTDASALMFALWLPPEATDDVTARLQSDLRQAAPGFQVEVWDNRDWGSAGYLDTATQWVIYGVGGFALLLGGLGLVNISLTTVRYRIREIGIRRSFGATSGRVFVSVMMESVVATVLAGLVGVTAAVALVKNLPTDLLFGTPLQDTPPFPIMAALVGMAAATGIGALAGVLPAIVAVRVKVIDAIRY